MRKKFVCALWALFIVCFGTLTTGVLAIDRGLIGYMPEMSTLQDPINKSASTLYTADGKSLGNFSLNQYRQFVPYDSISPNVFRALIATEDVRFYSHNGIDLRALGRAVVKRGLMGQRSAGGGSTITQQLAKQLYSEKAHSTLERLLQKPIEWVIAVELERHYTKEEILTLYLNYFDFLHNAIGIKSAAKVYFNKSALDLTTEEAALLVGMCKNPAYYNPLRQPERCKARRNTVLDQMTKAGYLTAADAARYKPDDIHLDFQRIARKESKLPYLKEYLRRILTAQEPNPRNYSAGQRQRYYEDSLAWATDPLYGWCAKNTKHNGKPYDLYEDGLRVYATVDSRMQQYAEEAAYDHVVRHLQPIFNAQRRSTKNFPYVGVSKATINNILNRNIKQTERYRSMKAAGATDEAIIRAFNTKVEMSVFTYHGEVDTLLTPIDSILYYKSFLRTGLVSMDPMTGYIKAYVGGLDYNHFQYDMGMVGRRQVGSTMKPFVFAMAMEDGKTPETVVSGARPRSGTGGWWPKGHGGVMSLRSALAASSNPITAKVMLETDPTGKRLEKMMTQELGVANADMQPSVVLCLGTADITPCELASGYTMFANRGIHSAPIIVSRIEDSQGHIIAEFKPRQNEVLSELSASEMIDMLKAVVSYGTGRRVHGYFNVSGEMGGKTGTTNNNSDGWYVGLVPRLVTAVWVGGEDRDIHFQSTSIGQGAASALPIWGKYMRKVYDDETLGYNSADKFPKFDDPAPGNEIINGYGDAPELPNKTHRRTTPAQDAAMQQREASGGENGSDGDDTQGSKPNPAAVTTPKETTTPQPDAKDLFE